MAFLFVNVPFSGGIGKFSFDRYNRKVPEYTEFLRNSYGKYNLSVRVCWRGPAQDSPFSSHHLISVNYKVVSQLSQSISLSFSYLNIARHNLVIELCRALKIFYFCSGLFIKLTCSFYLLNYWLFQNCKITFYCSRELSVFGLKEKCNLTVLKMPILQ